MSPKFAMSLLNFTIQIFVFHGSVGIADDDLRWGLHLFADFLGSVNEAFLRFSLLNHFDGSHRVIHGCELHVTMGNTFSMLYIIYKMTFYKKHQTVSRNIFMPV